MRGIDDSTLVSHAGQACTWVPDFSRIGPGASDELITIQG
jgi:hypothetical protein